jgi:hypothetical protein
MVPYPAAQALNWLSYFFSNKNYPTAAANATDM